MSSVVTTAGALVAPAGSAVVVVVVVVVGLDVVVGVVDLYRDVWVSNEYE